MKLRVMKLGRMDYLKALALQEEILAQRQGGQCDDTLMLLEHPPVITMGIRGQYGNILAGNNLLKEEGVSIISCNRGGDVTYHGLGQIVGYPIFDLTNFNRDIKGFVHKIEQVFINIMSEEYGIGASLGDKKETGIFVGNDKLTAIGIAVKKRVTMHGFAFNVNTNLDHFKWIVPCGLTDKGVTSVERLTGKPADMDRLMDLIVQQFEHLFELDAY